MDLKYLIYKKVLPIPCSFHLCTLNYNWLTRNQLQSTYLSFQLDLFIIQKQKFLFQFQHTEILFFMSEKFPAEQD